VLRAQRRWGTSIKGRANRSAQQQLLPTDQLPFVFELNLDRERKTMMRLWAKREEQIRGVVESTAGLYGDLQGIAGRSLLEIEGLEMRLLDGPAAECRGGRGGGVRTAV
jgi:hypothetical protein